MRAAAHIAIAIYYIHIVHNFMLDHRSKREYNNCGRGGRIPDAAFSTALRCRVAALAVFKEGSAMKKKDHLRIGKLLLAQKGVQLSGLKRLMFLFGCIEPDINPLTYTRGSLRHEFMHGHHADNSFKHRSKLMKKLTRKGVHSPWQWFSFGTLIHYSADSFTFPHNRIFGGTMAEHVKYEKQLHAAFEDYISRMAARRAQPKGIRSLDTLHERYMSGAGTAATDCRYIMDSAKWLWNNLLTGTEHPAPAKH